MAGAAVEGELAVVFERVLGPHERLKPATQASVGKKLRTEYESGTSIRQLSAQTGYSITRVRGLLLGAETVLRVRGRH